MWKLSERWGHEGTSRCSVISMELIPEQMRGVGRGEAIEKVYRFLSLFLPWDSPFCSSSAESKHKSRLQRAGEIALPEAERGSEMGSEGSSLQQTGVVSGFETFLIGISI